MGIAAGILLIILIWVIGAMVNNTLEKERKLRKEYERRLDQHNKWLRTLENKEPLAIQTEVRNVLRRGGA